MGKRKKNGISCIQVQVTGVPRDPVTRTNVPLGSRLIINKKKFPYLIKFGYIKIKKDDQVFTLYEDEIEIIITRHGITLLDDPPYQKKMRRKKNNNI